MCNAPHERERYRLAILREPNSRGGSAAIHDTFDVGRSVTIGEPRNNFQLQEDAQRSILLAGGIGVTPLLAMAYRLDRIGADFAFHYCTRTPARTAFAHEISRSAFSARAHLHHDDGPPEQRFTFERLLPAADGDTHIYVCGPAGFMDYVVGSARRAGWPPERVHVEYFINENVTLAGDAFEVVLARSGRTVVVAADKTILQVLQDNGIAIPVSCEQGVCGTCLTPVVKGIPDHRDLYQTDAEKAANSHITVCCSRSLSDVLVLDL